MKTQTLTSPPRGTPDFERWLEEIVSLQEAAALRGVHTETIKREGRRGRLTLIRVSTRRLGVRRRDVLYPQDESRKIAAATAAE
jgi:IS30 family transposase